METKKIFEESNRNNNISVKFEVSNGEPETIWLDIFPNTKTEKADIVEAFEKLQRKLSDKYTSAEKIFIQVKNTGGIVEQAIRIIGFCIKERDGKTILFEKKLSPVPKNIVLQKPAEKPGKRRTVPKKHISKKPAFNSRFESLHKIAMNTQKQIDAKTKITAPLQTETKNTPQPTTNTPRLPAKTPEIISQEPKKIKYPIIIEIKNPDPRKTKNDLTDSEENLLKEKGRAAQIKKLIDEIFSSIKNMGVFFPIKIMLKNLLIAEETQKKLLLSIIGKKLNRGDYGLSQNQIEKIILSEDNMEIFFEHAPDNKKQWKTG